jgi:hypothetical protein
VNEIIELILRTYGIVGLLIAAPFFAVIILWRENRRLHAETVHVQRCRVEDSQSVVSKLVDVVSEQSSLSRETNKALDRIADVMTHCQSVIRR